MSLRSTVLGTSRGYAAFRRLLRAERATTTVVSEHVRPKSGQRVLDLGCGNGDLVRFLGDVEYVGVDHNSRYLDRLQTSERVRFIDADLGELSTLDLGTFDVIVALGVLHHLDTELATSVIDVAASLLKPDGRMVTLDPVFHPEQRATARVLMALDRGHFVRHPEDYDRLLARRFGHRHVTIRSDLTPFPYTHCVIESTASRSPESSSAHDQNKTDLATTPLVVPFNRPYAGSRLGEHVARAARSTHHSGDGPIAAECVERLSSVLGGRTVVLTPSGTHALELAALVLGVGAGDEVVVPAFTFTSTATAFALRGAKIRFADIDPATLNLAPDSVEQRLNQHTKVVVPVHYAGVACDMNRLQSIATNTGISIVEDNAHGLFGSLQSQPLGTMGRLAALSFHETKNVSSGEGGALVVNDRTLLDDVLIAREKGTNRHSFFQGLIDKYTWVGLGSSWLPSEFTAAVLLAGLEDANETQRSRQHVWNRYAVELAAWATANGVQLPVISESVVHPAHLFHMVFSEPEHRRRFIDHMGARAVQVVFHYQALHLTDAARRFGQADECPVAQSVAERLVRLPLYARLSELQVERVIESVRSFTP